MAKKKLTEEQKFAILLKDKKATQKILLKNQKNEINGSVIYGKMANRVKDKKNKKILNEISKDELQHYKEWKVYTNVEIKPNRFYVCWCMFLSFIFGYTFVIKMLEHSEKIGAKNYKLLSKAYPEAIKMQADEEKHEAVLIAMLKDTRVDNVGAMVLGINDALVELTGSIAGFTFAYMDARMTALSAIIVGVSATLSMAAASFLSENARGNKKAFLAALFTGGSYLVVVALLVLPFFLFPTSMYLWAFVTMICVVVLIVAITTFYVSTIQGKTFWKHFLIMLAISLGVAAVSYGIGVLTKTTMGIDL